MRKMKNLFIIMTTYLLLLAYMVMAVIEKYTLMTVCAVIVAMVIYANLTDEREENEK